MREIKTHEELLGLHGASVTCEIVGRDIKDSRVSVVEDSIYICQDITDGEDCGSEKFGYKYSWGISDSDDNYEEYSRKCKNIKLVDETIDTEPVDPIIDINTEANGKLIVMEAFKLALKRKATNPTDILDVFGIKYVFEQDLADGCGDHTSNDIIDITCEMIDSGKKTDDLQTIDIYIEAYKRFHGKDNVVVVEDHLGSKILIVRKD